MAQIISNIGTVIGYVWLYMGEDFLPGISFRVVFIFTWLLAICVELVVNIGIGFFMGEDDTWN